MVQQQNSLPANGKRVAISSPRGEEQRKRPRFQQGKEYSYIRAIVITFKVHDSDSDDFEEEIENVVNFFENCLGVYQCVQVRLPSWWSDMGPYARDVIKDFKERSQDAAALNLVYYAGHGGYGWDGMTFTTSSGRGQSLDWNSLQWDSIFSGDSDTLVFLDCCFAEASFSGSSQGCKIVFGACSALDTTTGPGHNSFSDLFVRAGWSLMNTEFTLEDWVHETKLLASVQGCAPPVCQSLGDARHQIRFKPWFWLGRKAMLMAERAKEASKEARRNQERRVELIELKLQEVWKCAGLNEEKFPVDEDITQIEADWEVVEPFTQVGVYRAYRRVKDRQAEESLEYSSHESSEAFDEDSEESQGDSEQFDEDSEEFEGDCEQTGKDYEQFDEYSEDFEEDSGEAEG